MDIEHHDTEEDEFGDDDLAVAKSVAGIILSDLVHKCFVLDKGNDYEFCIN